MKDQIILTAKDEEILKYRRKGFPLKLIASFVFLSREAVRNRLSRLRQKTGAKNDIELIDFCHQNGLFTTKAA
jgi:DNA-binding NarL/FixJ family response regulator